MRLNKEYMGTIALSPETDVTAGEFSTWTITFTAGEYGIDDGGTMVIAWKSVSDWDSPQFDEPDMPGLHHGFHHGPVPGYRALRQVCPLLWKQYFN